MVLAVLVGPLAGRPLVSEARLLAHSNRADIAFQNPDINAVEVEIAEAVPHHRARTRGAETAVL